MVKFLSLFFLSAAMMLMACSSFAQLRKIPAEVTEALKAKYPEASNVTWKDKLSVFAAAFVINGEKMEARFNSKGEWQSTEIEIADNDLPEEVRDGLNKSKYSEWEVKSVVHIDLPDDKVEFRIQVAKSDVQKKNLLFNSEGQLLKDNITL
jgi:hypothetical protein